MLLLGRRCYITVENAASTESRGYCLIKVEKCHQGRKHYQGRERFIKVCYVNVVKVEKAVKVVNGVKVYNVYHSRQRKIKKDKTVR